VVVALPRPARPLTGGTAWTWRWRAPTRRRPWAWCRIYHAGPHSPTALTHRRNGPRNRLDPHTLSPDGDPWDCPDGRSVLYVAGNLTTAVGEVYGDIRAAEVCPHARVALLRPRVPVAVLDLRAQGAAMRIGALPSLATGAYPRARTQEWARAIHEDQPVPGTTVRGVYYDAAHTNGPALALWNTEGDVELLSDSRGREQDYALSDPRVWPRVVTAAVRIGMRADVVGACPQCPTDP
jgi:RES domain